MAKQNGYIYLIGDQRTGYTKIGFSKNPHHRLKQITHESTLLPEPLQFYIMHAFKGTLQEEQQLHEIFKSFRIRGEWFDLCFWRYMTIIDAFDCRERLSGFEWERCGDRTKPFECFNDIEVCECRDCSPHLWNGRQYLGKAVNA